MNKSKDCLMNKFNEWLAGLIDGDGCFQLSKKGYASLEITMELRDKHCLFLIKNKFGGSIKIKNNVNFLRYRLHHKEGIINMITSINGLIRNPIRILQLTRLCEKYKLELINPVPLKYNNAWLSGLLDSDGSVYLNEQSVQICISITQKNKLILDILVNLYGGCIYINSKTQSFKWIVFNKKEVINLLNNYFNEYDLKSKKWKRINLIPYIYDCFSNSGHKLSSETVYGKIWIKLKKKWDEYN